MAKNMAKYNSYRWAMEQVNKGIAEGFFLEAITIEESILTDRLLLFYRQKGHNQKESYLTLGRILAFLKQNETLCKDNGIDFVDDLDQFWKNRNTCLHQIAKSEPGTATLDIEELTRLASTTAINGKLLVKEVGGWSGKYIKGKVVSRSEELRKETLLLPEGKKREVIQNVIKVYSLVKSRRVGYNGAVRQLTKDQGLKSTQTIYDACTGRIELSTTQFLEMLEDGQHLENHLITMFPEHESDIRESFAK
jgi:hypothetical protein